MSESSDKLFQIGEVTKALGVTRKMILNYEELGLLTPAYKNAHSGYRYYSADNMVHIRNIRLLQDLGLSLSEVHAYFENIDNLGEQIDRLVQLRNQLNQYIWELQLRKRKLREMEVNRVTLPSFTAYCLPFRNVNLAEKTAGLRNAYITAIKNYQIDVKSKMCIEITTHSEGSGHYIIPVVSGSRGENIRIFPETEAICIYYRGPYEDFPTVYTRLLRYAKDYGLIPGNSFRNIFMEGPPTHGDNKDCYITQVALLL